MGGPRPPYDRLGQALHSKCPLSHEITAYRCGMPLCVCTQLAGAGRGLASLPYGVYAPGTPYVLAPGSYGFTDGGLAAWAKTRCRWG